MGDCFARHFHGLSGTGSRKSQFGGKRAAMKIGKQQTPYKSVVEENWLCEFEGGKNYSGKALIGWNAAEKKITYGSMDSSGGMMGNQPSHGGSTRLKENGRLPPKGSC